MEARATSGGSDASGLVQRPVDIDGLPADEGATGGLPASVSRADKLPVAPDNIEWTEY